MDFSAKATPEQGPLASGAAGPVHHRASPRLYRARAAAPCRTLTRESAECSWGQLGERSGRPRRRYIPGCVVAVKLRIVRAIGSTVAGNPDLGIQVPNVVGRIVERLEGHPRAGESRL